MVMGIDKTIMVLLLRRSHWLPYNDYSTNTDTVYYFDPFNHDWLLEFKSRLMKFIFS